MVIFGNFRQYASQHSQWTLIWLRSTKIQDAIQELILIQKEPQSRLQNCAEDGKSFTRYSFWEISHDSCGRYLLSSSVICCYKRIVFCSNIYECLNRCLGGLNVCVQT